jgi:hypothetical protein
VLPRQPPPRPPQQQPPPQQAEQLPSAERPPARSLSPILNGSRGGGGGRPLNPNAVAFRMPLTGPTPTRHLHAGSGGGGTSCAAPPAAAAAAESKVAPAPIVPSAKAPPSPKRAPRRRQQGPPRAALHPPPQPTLAIKGRGGGAEGGATEREEGSGEATSRESTGESSAAPPVGGRVPASRSETSLQSWRDTVSHDADVTSADESLTTARAHSAHCPALQAPSHPRFLAAQVPPTDETHERPLHERFTAGSDLEVREATPLAPRGVHASLAFLAGERLGGRRGVPPRRPGGGDGRALC